MNHMTACEAFALVGPGAIGRQNREKFKETIFHLKERSVFLDVGCERGEWVAQAIDAGFQTIIAVDTKLHRWNIQHAALRGSAAERGINLIFIEAEIRSLLDIGGKKWLALPHLAKFAGHFNSCTPPIIDLLKVDIEGEEFTLFASPLDLLTWTRVLNIEMHDLDFDQRERFLDMDIGDFDNETAFRKRFTDAGFTFEKGGIYYREEKQ